MTLRNLMTSLLALTLMVLVGGCDGLAVDDNSPQLEGPDKNEMTAPSNSLDAKYVCPEGYKATFGDSRDGECLASQDSNDYYLGERYLGQFATVQACADAFEAVNADTSEVLNYIAFDIRLPDLVILTVPQEDRADILYKDTFGLLIHGLTSISVTDNRTALDDQSIEQIVAPTMPSVRHPEGEQITGIYIVIAIGHQTQFECVPV